MNVLLSIRPKYCQRISDGTKKYEFRKSIFRNWKGVDLVLMYSTSPVRKIVGSFKIESVIEGTPRNLWEKFKENSGIDQTDFFNYFGFHTKGFAIKIKDVSTFDPIEPKVFLTDFYPPQSFSYINPEQENNTLFESLTLHSCK